MQLFVLFILLGIIMGFFIVYILVGAGIVKLEVDIDTNVENPAVSEISSNSFLKLTNDYPMDHNRMINLLSMYKVSGDATLQNDINAQRTGMFAVVESDKVMLKVGDYLFNDGLIGPRETVFRKIAIPEGSSEEIQLRFYEEA